MKVAVYTIALNEEQFVAKWHESAKEADYLLIADTGSTDKTIKLAKKLGINVINITIEPWRFDLARNASLAALPSDIDYCIALDMDEVLLPGWRAELEKAYKNKITRPRYQYTWNWLENGEPGLQYGGDKIHTRFGYKWKHPVHEVLTPYGETLETQEFIGLEIHHHADNTKPRSQYLPLLKQAVDEDLNDDRNAFYYARELYFYNKYPESAAEFKRHLSLERATWKPERAASMRYLAKVEPDKAESWLRLAIQEAPDRREAYFDLAQYYYGIQDWKECLEACKSLLQITEKPLEYLCEEKAWGYLPFDLAAISSFYLGKLADAESYNLKAMALNPDDDRLKNNHIFYTSSK